ncbi:hypothetical protein U0070_022739 [Myodes glareolus]|uniref:Receptor-interacting serine/threonine-protein kinase 2 n=1 Tax=Myodes glareolus TaxID=447135 RepID=A0AAW0J7P0_MYOGA
MDGDAICSALPPIPYHKLADLHYLSRGASGTVSSARHADWRVRVAVKHLHIHTPLLDSRKSSGALQSGLSEMKYTKTEYPEVAWPLRFRILHEIALGVNYLHNMNPPLLHHDLKTQNILLDNEFHVKGKVYCDPVQNGGTQIADFGLSKWRMMSLSQSRSSKSAPEGGTIIYMPPENYEPGQKSRASVKHDIYSYAIIMWEVLSRKQPFEEVTNPLQIMYSVSQGRRPDTSEESLPSDVPHRGLMVSLIQSGWAQNPDERPSFLRGPPDCSSLKLHHCPGNHSWDGTVSASQRAAICDHRPTLCSLAIINPLLAEKSAERLQPGIAQQWIQSKREDIVSQMTEACLNQSLDALLSRDLIMKEDYELISTKPTRTSKVRQLLDTSDIQGEEFAKVIVQKLKDNKQMGLQPYPELPVVSRTPASNFLQNKSLVSGPVCILTQLLPAPVLGTG